MPLYVMNDALSPFGLSMPILDDFGHKPEELAQALRDAGFREVHAEQKTLATGMERRR